MGRIFSLEHRRLAGFHIGIPFSNSASKARDPFINLNTLSRISHSNDQKIRKFASDSLAKRLSGDPSLLPLYKITHDFSRGVVAQALASTSATALNNSVIIQDFIKSMNISESRLATASNNPKMLRMFFDYAQIPQDTMAEIAAKIIVAEIKPSYGYGRQDAARALELLISLTNNKALSHSEVIHAISLFEPKLANEIMGLISYFSDAIFSTMFDDIQGEIFRANILAMGLGYDNLFLDINQAQDIAMIINLLTRKSGFDLFKDDVGYAIGDFNKALMSIRTRTTDFAEIISQLMEINRELAIGVLAAGSGLNRQPV